MAIQAVKDGGKTLRVAKRFVVPRSTLEDKINERRQSGPVGAKKMFREQQEQALVNRLFYMGDRGFPLTTKWLRYNAYLYAKKLHRRRLLQKDIPTTWHKSHLTSYDCFQGFKRRHSLRAPEGLSKARAEALNKERIEKFFKDKGRSKY